MPIKVRLQEILNNKGMSQRELARLTGLRPNTISHLCSNTATSVYFDTLEIICKTLNIELQELLELE
ncbi:helix-turn-helix transcriptional regulator [Brevibacillus agri]|jgi:putative transcriptional regulator|uniref:helix-turn-helix domain-containing protein n=1 Tax=Brevibacillus TaxID=55080 RepID=UPI0002A50BD7|nr:MULTISPECIES: helix-turn-helix transcriptional regulator [Brevibacillus]ELK42384.1 helix-turn-helix domain-containing protein [Brevibacillus agri BAB-2500]MBY0050774.1 helix-turn-helix transcriptional regulator [Brevibacillus agri]MCC0566453.1 helix-turn-helix transcriptional regulator [Brevibacillus borstelensis]MCM3559958.1 helix-turn-helix transcriptional regulator [Brevibacillus borstelensis]